MSDLFFKKSGNRVPPSPQKKKKISVELARKLIFFFFCNAPPQAGQGCGPTAQIPEREEFP